LLTGVEAAADVAGGVLRHADGEFFGHAGAACEQSGGYPGWKPDLSSKLLQVARETYRRMYGKEPKVTAIHAGLETGILGSRIPGMDMLSFGPQIEGAHSPDERVHVPSVVRFYDFLKGMLQALA
jgi:dipeptidase D